MLLEVVEPLMVREKVPVEASSPVPVRGMVEGDAGSLERTLRVPGRWPVAAGVKVMAMERDASRGEGGEGAGLGDGVVACGGEREAG